MTVDRKTGPFGIEDLISCKLCGTTMTLYRRGPHPKRVGLEVQRFECRECKFQFARTVNKAGETLQASKLYDRRGRIIDPRSP